MNMFYAFIKISFWLSNILKTKKRSKLFIQTSCEHPTFAICAVSDLKFIKLLWFVEESNFVS